MVTQKAQQADQYDQGPKVIAKVSKTLVVFVALLSSLVLVGAFLTSSLLAYFWLICLVLLTIRVSQINLELSEEGVTIRNFFRTTHIPLWEAEVEVHSGEKTVLLSDSGGKLDKEGRMLYVTRTWHEGERVHVGAVPRFGHEFDRVHDELVTGIKALRAA